ncbi:Uncharacterized protein TCM_025048 [Theobroma cacao]|uniref:Uncharacterized protein n=1 Tax=Theobroma cacao TaxID=3641 RepID=A0A061EYF2_THECC|nr:Uncharacterized protein TCM_025048 [Theobroma cacao]
MFMHIDQKLDSYMDHRNWTLKLCLQQHCVSKEVPLQKQSIFHDCIICSDISFSGEGHFGLHQSYCSPHSPKHGASTSRGKRLAFLAKITKVKVKVKGEGDIDSHSFFTTNR